TEDRGGAVGSERGCVREVRNGHVVALPGFSLGSSPGDAAGCIREGQASGLTLIRGGRKREHLELADRAEAKLLVQRDRRLRARGHLEAHIPRTTSARPRAT